jgi:hypothetical protein
MFIRMPTQMQANPSAVMPRDMKRLSISVSYSVSRAQNQSRVNVHSIAGKRKPGSTDARAPFDELVAVKVCTI